MRKFLLVCCILSISCFAGEEKMYVWVDENGKKHFSQKPPPNKNFSEKTVKYRLNNEPARRKPVFDFEKARPKDSDVCNLAIRRYLGQWRQSILQKFRDGTAACDRMNELKVLSTSVKKCYIKQEKLKNDELKTLSEYKTKREC